MNAPRKTAAKAPTQPSRQRRSQAPAKGGARSRQRVDVALQGGGSHGAFTWGVLDRLLEEGNLSIEGVSGTSAGAMNAAVMVHGHTLGGPERARLALETFWSKVSQAAAQSPFQRGPLDVMMGRWTLDNSPLFMAYELSSRLFSPYMTNPFNINPLEKGLREFIDYEAIARSDIQLFVTATNVHTGQGRVFRNAEISAEVLMASACLPMMFQAVEIDGVPYWDGGYAGNPTITPLVRECHTSSDTIIVQINPVERKETPRSPSAILNRLNEVSFNATMLKELRMMALLRRVAPDKSKDAEAAGWARMRVHRIASDIMLELGYSSKLNSEWAFLTKLRDAGRQAADDFLRDHGNDLGVRSSFDIDALI